MKRILAVCLGLMAVSAFAEVDPLAREAIDIIRRGRNHAKQIQDLRVKDDATIGGTLTVTGVMTPSGGISAAGNVTASGSLTGSSLLSSGGLTIISGAYTGVLNIVSTTLTLVVNGSVTNVLDADITTP